MLAQVTEYFEIEADIDLKLMQPNQTLASLTARCLEKLDAVLQATEPHCVVAQGDTTTVLSAALCAFYRRLPFVHVEAGLRTGDLYAPWPEEMNRRVASITTSLHCVPTQKSAENLYRENYPQTQVHITGNTVIDSLLYTVERERQNGEVWSQKYDFLGTNPMVLITGHRRENFGSGFLEICQAISELSQRFPETSFVYPVHLNPNVQKPVHDLLANLKNVYLVSPAPYPEFVWLMDRSTLILTDSGGVQEEAPSLKKPVIVMRETTERPEAVEAGAVELVGTSREKIVSSISLLLSNSIEYSKRQVDKNPYGDGKSAKRIVDLMLAQKWHH